MPTANHLALQFLPVNETDVDEHLGLKKPGGACLVAADMMPYIERSVLKTWLNSVTQISVFSWFTMFGLGVAMQVGYDAVPWQLRSSSESDPSGAGVAKWKNERNVGSKRLNVTRRTT